MVTPRMRNVWVFAGIVTVAALAGGARSASAGAATLAEPCRVLTSAGAAVCPMTVQVRVTQAPMNPDPASETPTTATCATGTRLVGGGILQDRDDGTLPANGLRAHGDVPSNASGAFATNGSFDPTSWTAVGGFGGAGEIGDEVKAFALCATNGPYRTLVVSKTERGPARAATILKVTVTCPANSSLIGGGGATHPPTDPSLKTIGSYPSTRSGAPFAAGEADPQSWTAVGAAGGMRIGAGVAETSAFAICALATHIPTTVAQREVKNHPQGPGNLDPGSDPFAILTATCKRGAALLGGGVLADLDDPGAGIVAPQQGVHVRGSYPSDTQGSPLGDRATVPASWTAIVQSGGQATPGTDSYVFALCEA